MKTGRITTGKVIERQREVERERERERESLFGVVREYRKTGRPESVCKISRDNKGRIWVNNERQGERERARERERERRRRRRRRRYP